MKSTHVLPVLIATAAASLVFAGGAGATRSKPVACGDTITASVKLDHDLTDCPSNGIVIGADGITLDLNGHTIDGDDALQDCEPGADCDLGVLNIGHRAVKIKGGAIGEFGVGLVVAAGSDDNRLRDLAVTANEFAGVVHCRRRRRRHQPQLRDPQRHRDRGRRDRALQRGPQPGHARRRRQPTATRASPPTTRGASWSRTTMSMTSRSASPPTTSTTA